MGSVRGSTLNTVAHGDNTSPSTDTNSNRPLKGRCCAEAKTSVNANIFVISGPGGVGKGTVVSRLLEDDDALWLSRSWTTRNRRCGEAHDAYVFVSREEFEAKIEADGFLEWVEFLDYLQGTPLPDPPANHDVIFEIDVAGAAQISDMFPDAVLIFIDAPSAEEQRRRLENRGDDAKRIQQRLDTAINERIAAENLGCTQIVNEDVDVTVARLQEIISQTRNA